MRLTSPSGGRAACAAFTLIELLTVVAIIGILAAITFGVSRGVNQRAAINQARAELSVLASALEAYKRQYGDYPQAGRFTEAIPPTTASATNQPGHLFNALVGKIGPKLAAYKGKTFVDISNFSLQSATATDIPTIDGDAVNNSFIDPWGRPYIYSYRTSDGGGWNSSSYLLFSAGPDGRLNPPSEAGVLNKEHQDNLDNIYPN